MTEGLGNRKISTKNASSNTFPITRGLRFFSAGSSSDSVSSLASPSQDSSQWYYEVRSTLQRRDRAGLQPASLLDLDGTC